MVKISSILLVICCVSYLEIVESIDCLFEKKVVAVIDKSNNIYIIEENLKTKTEKAKFGEVYSIFECKNDKILSEDESEIDAYHKRETKIRINTKSGVTVSKACSEKTSERKCKQFCINGICRLICRSSTIEKCRTLIG